MGRIFISYRRSDAAAMAGSIYEAMAARFGRQQVFRDTSDMPVGVRFPEFLQQTLYGCQVALILIGPTWLRATNPDGTRRLDDPHDFVRLEIETALKRGLLVCPLLLGGAAMPARAELPPSIREVHWYNALPIRSGTEADFVQDMDRLAADISRAVEGKGGALVERFALVGRTTAIPLAAGAAGVVWGATATAAKSGAVGDLFAKAFPTVTSKVAAGVAAVVVVTTVAVAVIRPSQLPFSSTPSATVGRYATPSGGTATSTLGPAGTVTEFAIPTANGGLVGITRGPDGNLWFTESNVNQIGRITPSGSVTEFPLPTAGSFPTYITNGPDGSLWFTEAHANQIGRITPSGSVTEFPLLTGNSAPNGITSGPDGNLWFTEEVKDKIGRIAP